MTAEMGRVALKLTNLLSSLKVTVTVFPKASREYVPESGESTLKAPSKGISSWVHSVWAFPACQRL
jgi:hypothetical protein